MSTHQHVTPMPTPAELEAARARVETIMPGVLALAMVSGWPDYRADLETVLRSYGDAELDESSCEGHPAGPGDPMGETVYCDGSCKAAA